MFYFSRLGVPRKIIKSQISLILKKLVVRPNKNFAEIFKEMASEHLFIVSKDTIRCSFDEAGLSARVSEKKILFAQRIEKSDRY